MGFANNSYLINKLEVCNFRKFESISVSFERQLTVLVGDNGVGKSTGFCRGVWRCAHSRRILCNLVKRERFARIMSNVERYKNLYFCDCA